jgi:TolB-like protein/tetratricopeptide (TPR) repeat protein
VIVASSRAGEEKAVQTSLPIGNAAAPAPPRDPPSFDEIREQLERILNSPEFPHTGRGAAFLTYVIDEALAGRSERIKGYSIAVEVFKRSEGFSQDDPVVRIEAGKMRRILERYYLVAGQSDPVRIDIPKGGYVPAFSWNCPLDGPAAAANDLIKPVEETAPRFLSRKARSWLGVVAILCGTVTATAAITERLNRSSSTSSIARQAPHGPSLVIAPFANLGEGLNAEFYTVGLSEELITALPRFKEIKVFGRETSKSLPPEVASSKIRDELGARFLLAGGVRVSGNMVRVTARLLDTETGGILWSQTYDDEIRAGRQFAIQSDIANKVASAVAQPYGIMAKADVANPPPDDLGIQTCTLSFYSYRAELRPDRHAQVRDCLENAVARYPTFATAWAMLSIVYLDEDRFKFNTRSDASTPIERSLQAARRATQIDPDNTRALQALMTALFFSNQVREALDVGEQALESNPNDTELLGEFGTRVAMSGQWQRGAELLDQALALNPGGAGFYHGTRALAAYMLHDNETAIIEIKEADLQKFPLYHAVAAVIYADAGMIEDARREGARFNEMRPDFIPNVIAELKARNFQASDRARMIADLRKAGLAAEDEVASTKLVPEATSSTIQPR